VTPPLLQTEVRRGRTNKNVERTRETRGRRRAWGRGSGKARVIGNTRFKVDREGQRKVGLNRRGGREVGSREIVVGVRLLFRVVGRGHGCGFRWAAVSDRATASGDAVVDTESTVLAVEKGVVTMGADVHVEIAGLTHFAVCGRFGFPASTGPGLFPSTFHGGQDPMSSRSFKSESRIVGQDGCEVRSKTSSGNSVRTLFASRSDREVGKNGVNFGRGQSGAILGIRNRAAKLVNSHAIPRKREKFRIELFGQVTDRGRGEIKSERNGVRFVIVEFDRLGRGKCRGRHREGSLGALKPEQGGGIALAIHFDLGGPLSVSRYLEEHHCPVKG